MTTKQQFEAMWRVGCKNGILAIIRNRGKPLSPKQIRLQIRNSLRRGLVDRALVLASLSGSTLTSAEVERLVRRCLQLGWIPDALQACGADKVSGASREKLLRSVVQERLVHSPRAPGRSVPWLDR